MDWMNRAIDKETIAHMRTMVLVYLPTKLGDFLGQMLVNIPYMEHTAYGLGYV